MALKFGYSLQELENIVRDKVVQDFKLGQRYGRTMEEACDYYFIEDVNEFKESVVREVIRRKNLQKKILSTFLSFKLTICTALAIV
jgi:hypothetical protein